MDDHDKRALRAGERLNHAFREHGLAPDAAHMVLLSLLFGNRLSFSDLMESCRWVRQREREINAMAFEDFPPEIQKLLRGNDPRDDDWSINHYRAGG